MPLLLLNLQIYIRLAGPPRGGANAQLPPPPLAAPLRDIEGFVVEVNCPLPTRAADLPLFEVFHWGEAICPTNVSGVAGRRSPPLNAWGILRTMLYCTSNEESFLAANSNGRKFLYNCKGLDAGSLLVR